VGDPQLYRHAQVRRVSRSFTVLFQRCFAQSFVVALSLLCLGQVAHARTYDEVIDSGYIEIAVYNDFPPYSFMQDGQPTGIDIEVGQLIARELGVEPRWFWFNADETLDDDLRNAVWKGHYLNRRVADLMMRVPYDPEYKRMMDGYGQLKNEMVVMFGPYHRERWWIARDTEQTGEVRNLANFMYMPIGVEIDTLPDFFLSSALRGRLRDKIEHYPGIPAALEALVKGKVAAVVGTRSQLQWGLRGQSFDLSADGLEAMGHSAWDIGLAVRHNFRQLGYAVGDAVTSLTQSGELATVFERYNVHYEVPAAYQ
jgi:polar amino acid transport system substrate-binding protein